MSIIDSSVSHTTLLVVTSVVSCYDTLVQLKYMYYADFKGSL